jgi:hypothetical protein
MKKTIRHSLAVMAMLGVITSYANFTPTFPLNKNVKTTILNLDNVKQGQRLLIKSKNGIILYKESINETGDYRKEFDLTSLPNGNYFFELEKDMEIQIIPFSVSSRTVAFSKENEVRIFKPVVRAENNKVFVSKLSLEQRPMTLEIFYDNPEGSGYESIYSDKIENTKIIERIYALDKTKTGNYKIVTKVDGRVYTQIVTI